MSTGKKLFSFHEDWIVVILGFLIIFVTLSGLVLPVPVLNWNNTTELFSTVLSAKNIQVILWQFLFVFVVAGLGTLLSAKPVKSFLTGFPVLYLLTMIALILSGSSAVRGLNLEAVIISLTIGLFISNFFTLPDGLRSPCQQNCM